MKKILLVIDMQNDFVDGALGTKEAQAMVPALLHKIEEEKQIGSETYPVGHTPNYIMAAVSPGKGMPGEIVKGRLSSINDSEIMLLS